MKLVINNISSKVIIGGKDFLLDFDILKELKKYLRVRPKGYNHSPLYRSRKWDGWRYFINAKGEFATGFVPLVCRYLEELGVEIEVEDLRTNLPTLQEDLTDFVGEIDGEVWTGRDYQMEAIKRITNYVTIGGKSYYFPRGILDCATNAGKNSISALVINNLPKDKKVVFMVSNSVIYSQAVEFFQQVLGREKLGQVCSGKLDFQRVTICMVKTLYNRAKESMQVKSLLSQVDCLIVDEADESGQTQYAKCLQFIPAPMRIFVSGTPLDGDKVTAMITMGLSGKVLYKITNKELIDKGVSQMPDIKILYNDSGKGSKLAMGYDDEMEEFVWSSEPRMKLIKDLVDKHSEEQILITFVRKEHGEFMYEYLTENCHSDIALVHGTTPNRDEIISDYKKGKVSVLIASMILKRGANIPVIRVGILAHSGKSVTTTKQIIGRLIRHDGKNSDVLVYEFMDRGKYLSKHSRARIRTYKNEGFNIEYLYPNVRGTYKKTD